MAVKFSGHEIGQGGIRPDPEKLKALLGLPMPNDEPGVKRVLGMLAYYRRFVPKFAILAEPLTRLTRKNQPFVWAREQKESFRALLRELSRIITMSYYNFSDPILIKTDASLQGIPGMLLQQQDGLWKPIACCSRRVSKSEEN